MVTYSLTIEFIFIIKQKQTNIALPGISNDYNYNTIIIISQNGNHLAVLKIPDTSTVCPTTISPKKSLGKKF